MVRAKFRVDSIQRSNYGSGEMQTIKLSPVCRTNDPDSENSKFWKYTPSGTIELGCCNPEAVRQFDLGKEYYVDFTPVPPAA